DHDRDRDDPRHAAHVTRLGRRRGTERAAGAGGHRRPRFRHPVHALLRARRPQRDSLPPAHADRRGRASSGDHMSAAPEILTPPRRIRSKRRLWIAAAALLLVLAGGFLAGYLPRRLARARLAATTPTAAVAPRVAVVKAAAVDAGRTLTLPAGLVANQQTLVYARASGYVNRWLVDIGDHVKKGQLLIQLDTPELDKQLAQARASLSQTIAALAQAQSNRELADITARREAALFAKMLISAQENDQARTQAAVWNANVNAAKANVAAQRANVGQLEQLASFGKVYAPYDGTITRRLVDVGTL